jgi:hypothetical protein
MAAVLAVLAVAATVFTGCAHQPVVRPHEVVVACGDGNFYVDKLRWSSWRGAAAVATGVAHENDCTPNCAAGHFHTYRAELRLSHVVRCVKGRAEFATIGWRFLAAKPAHVPRTDSETLPCRFLRLKP